MMRIASILFTLPWTCQGFSCSPESICFQFIKHIFPHFKIKVAKSTLRWAQKRLTPLFSAPRQCDPQRVCLLSCIFSLFFQTFTLSDSHCTYTAFSFWAHAFKHPEGERVGDKWFTSTCDKKLIKMFGYIQNFRQIEWIISIRSFICFSLTKFS